MESLLRYVRVPPNSASMEEARRHVFEFFKTACRSIPSIMEVYNLDDVVTPSQLRTTVSSMIRKNAHVTNPKVVDMLIIKGTEELCNIVEHSKQRHHILGQYVLGQEVVQDLNNKDHGASEFLKNFYKSNYF